jgi:8-oxo-dGTP pyrophosphatase MutT (NUDIX family)
MAGILFTNKTLVLAGFDNKTRLITGIGGKKKDGELPYQTAVRETLEELFDIDVERSLLDTLCGMLVFDTCIGSPNYTTFVMSFKDLQLILEVIYDYNVKSPIYYRIPNNLEELLVLRRSTENSELSALCLIPCDSYLRLDPCLLGDIRTFNKMEY